MSSLHENLVAVHRRLQSIPQLSIDGGGLNPLEEVEFDITKAVYVCAECAWTTSTSPGVLARHFTFKHASHPKYPDCKILYENQEELRKHQSQKYRHFCRACQRFSPTANECEHHEFCENQHRIAPKVRNDSSTHTISDQMTDEQPPAIRQSVLNRKGSVQSGSCPDPGCQLTFPDFDTLYEHYIGSHPLCIVYSGQSKPFKCPFCSKKYQNERFVPGHVRTHKPKSLSVTGIGDAEDQEALIRQSHVALANRESQEHAETQAQIDRISCDEEDRCSTPLKQEEDCSIVLKDCVVYMDEGVVSRNHTSKHSDPDHKQEAQCFGETTRVGIILQASDADLSHSHLANEDLSVQVAHRTPIAKSEFSDPMELNDDHPERFALDDDELPSGTSNRDSRITAEQSFDWIFDQRLLRATIRALQMHHFATVSEVKDLFTYFLNKYQQSYVLEQLGSINLNQNDSNLLEAIHATVFKDLLDAWVDFKRLAVRFVPQLVIQANNMGTGSTKSVTWALLQYCLNLEKMIYRNKINIAHHFLRDPPVDNFVVTPEAPFPCLVAALAERVKNRTVHDVSIPFTNEMILKGVGDYVKILQMIFRPLYPVAAGNEMLWKELRLR